MIEIRDNTSHMRKKTQHVRKNRATFSKKSHRQSTTTMLGLLNNLLMKAIHTGWHHLWMPMLLINQCLKRLPRLFEVELCEGAKFCKVFYDATDGVFGKTAGI